MISAENKKRRKVLELSGLKELGQLWRVGAGKAIARCDIGGKI